MPDMADSRFVWMATSFQNRRLKFIRRGASACAVAGGLELTGLAYQTILGQDKPTLENLKKQ